MVKQIIQIGDERLTKKSAEVNISSIRTPEVQGLIADITDTMRHHHLNGAGLSAVQIGHNKRIFTVRRYDLESSNKESKEEWEIMINPEIKILDSTLNTEWEGCLSIGTGEKRVFGPVSRPSGVEVVYYNKDGKKQKLHAFGFFSALIQHEHDHLEGNLFLKYVENPQNLWTEEDLDKYIKEYGSFPEVL